MNAKVINHFITQNEKGNHCLEIHWTSDSFQGAKKSYHYMTDKTIDKTLDMLKNVFEWDSFVEELNEGILIGKEAELVIETDEYNGRSREIIKYVNKKSTANPEALPSLLSKFTGRVKTRLHNEETPF